MFPGVYAKITDNVKKWIKTVTTGTQDECNSSRDYMERIRKMKKSADFDADDLDSKDDEEDKTNQENIKTGANQKLDTIRAVVRASEGDKPDDSVEKQQSSNPKRENDLSYVRQLLALLQAQGKM